MRSGMRLRRLAALATLLLAGAAIAPGGLAGRAAPDAEEILRRSEEARSPSVDYAVDFKISVLDDYSPGVERKGSYAMLARSLLDREEEVPAEEDGVLRHDGGGPEDRLLRGLPEDDARAALDADEDPEPGRRAQDDDDDLLGPAEDRRVPRRVHPRGDD